MTYLKKAINVRYIYLTLQPKMIKTKIYQYKHHFLLIILIYLNLFVKVFWLQYIYLKLSPINS